MKNSSSEALPYFSCHASCRQVRENFGLQYLTSNNSLSKKKKEKNESKPPNQNKPTNQTKTTNKRNQNKPPKQNPDCKSTGIANREVLKVDIRFREKGN